MVQIVTVYPGSDGESLLFDVSTDQFAEIIKHIADGPTRLNQNQSPSVDDYHNASRIQYVVHLEGISEIEVADGTIKRLNPGDILIAQDTTGHGHITRGIGQGIRVSMNVPLEEGPWLPKGWRIWPLRLIRVAALTKAALDATRVSDDDEVVRYGDHIEGLLEAWGAAPLEERHQLLSIMLDDVYVDMVQGLVLGLKPEFLPLFNLGEPVTTGDSELVTGRMEQSRTTTETRVGSVGVNGLADCHVIEESRIDWRLPFQ